MANSLISISIGCFLVQLAERKNTTVYHTYYKNTLLHNSHVCAWPWFGHQNPVQWQRRPVLSGTVVNLWPYVGGKSLMPIQGKPGVAKQGRVVLTAVTVGVGYENIQHAITLSVAPWSRYSTTLHHINYRSLKANYKWQVFVSFRQSLLCTISHANVTLLLATLAVK